MKNLYKRHDIFRCNQDAHRHFAGRVSVYHVLKEKQCYPQGCLYFLWHCTLLEKGNPCIHGFHHTGKRCRGCTYYDEEKVHLQPERIPDQETYEGFLDELEEFESWLESVRYRHLDVAGRIGIVKPWFELTRLPGKEHIKLRGYLLIFKRGFLGIKSFDDTFYIRISEKQMKTYGFVPKMKLELTGEVREDRGRVIIHRPGRIEILSRGWGRLWSRDRALVSVKTASLLREQQDQCLSCPWGSLTDVMDRRNEEEKRYRNLYCLKGIADPNGCYVRACRKLKKMPAPN